MQIAKEKFHDLLKDFNAVMLITHVTRGDAHAADINARPMGIAQVEPNCDLWFMTGADTETVHDIASDSHVHVTAQHTQELFLSVWGDARVVRNPAKVRELWKEEYKVWFPDGAEDPNIMLIHVATKAGEYWDITGANKVRYLFEAAKAYVTGERPQTHEGEQHGTVRLS